MHDNNMKGAIWANKEKASETHPDFKGNAEIDGTEYWVSAWRRSKDAKENSPSLKFSFTKKEAKWDEANKPSSVPDNDPGFDDDPGF